jgi:hypothetical protein
MQINYLMLLSSLKIQSTKHNNHYQDETQNIHMIIVIKKQA